MAALFRVDRMAGTGQTDTGRNKRARADVHRRSIQNDAVVVDDRQPVGVDVEAVVAVEIRLDAGHGRAGAQQLLQNRAALFRFVWGGAVVLPAQLLGACLCFGGGVFVTAGVGRRAFHNFNRVHCFPLYSIFRITAPSQLHRVSPARFAISARGRGCA